MTANAQTQRRFHPFSCLFPPPFFLKDIWVILRLEHWEGARLDDNTKEAILDEIFGEWLNKRVMQYLNGNNPGALPN